MLLLAIITEVIACFQAVETCLQLGFSSVEIEGDALVVVQKLKEKRVDKSIIRAHIRNIKASK